MVPESFETHPDRYKHWRLSVDGEVATLVMDVQEHACEGEDVSYQRKLNSYDLYVDVELADAVQRLRFEHPEVRAVVVTSERDRVFCSGANIFMLGRARHEFKVNFCKFTNETRLAMEDASQFSGQHYLAAIQGACAGGGYELALACDEIVLIDDRSSAVSLPEVPLLAVLPGTGGLTRLVDKRKVRPDLADAFCTTAEGVKGKRAVRWGVVDHAVPRSRFAAFVAERARALAARSSRRGEGPGVELPPLHPRIEGDRIEYTHVTLAVDRSARTAELTVAAPEHASPTSAEAVRDAGARWWPLAAFRELDDALLRLRFHFEDVGVVLLRTRGEADRVLEHDQVLYDLAEGDWFANEVRHFVKRVLKRLEVTSKAFYAVIDEGSCFAGTLLELAWAADRAYMLDDPDAGVTIRLGQVHAGFYPTANGLTRLERRFLARPEHVVEVLAQEGPLDAARALDLGLVTFAPDELDWDDELRLAVEERASLSPDALTGMEQNLRWPGPETLETKIFGRLSAWQNWIFSRPNATGPRGALTLYGRPERPQFAWRRA